MVCRLERNFATDMVLMSWHAGQVNVTVSSGLTKILWVLLSVIDDGGIFFQLLFRLPVKVTGHFVDLVFPFAAGAAQPYPSARAQHFQLMMAFTALHGV